MAEMSPVAEYLAGRQPKLEAELDHVHKVLGVAILIICVLTAALTGVTAAWLSS